MCHFDWFFQCFVGSLCIIFTVFFFWGGSLCDILIVFFSCFGLLVCHFDWFSNVLDS